MDGKAFGDAIGGAFKMLAIVGFLAGILFAGGIMLIFKGCNTYEIKIEKKTDIRAVES